MKNIMRDEVVTKSYVDRRFEQVDRRFEQVDRRFEQVDKRFEQVDRRLEQADEKLDKIINTLDSVMGKLETLEQENTIGTYQTRNLETAYEDHEKRISKLEQAIVTTK